MLEEIAPNEKWSTTREKINELVRQSPINVVGDVVGTSDVQELTSKTFNLGENALLGVDGVRILQVASLGALSALADEDLAVGGGVEVLGVGTYRRAPDAATDAHFDHTGVGGLKFYESGDSFTTLPRFFEALARGEAYADGQVVRAGKYVLSKRVGADISGAAGWAFETEDRPILPIPAFMASATKRFQFHGDREGGNHNVLQSFVIDYVNRDIYTSQVTGSGPEQVYINRYDLDGPFDQASLDYQNNTTEVRHQSLSMEYRTDGSVKLWSSSETDRHLLTRFDYVPLGDPANIEYFQVGDDSADERVWNVDILQDQSKLIAQSGTTIRVYDFQAMLSGGPGDYSDAALYEFETGVGSQGFTCDGDFLYVWAGSADITDRNRILVYTIYGELVLEVNDSQLGEAEAASEAPGLINEPEGIAVWRDKPTSSLDLAVGLVQGPSGYFPGRSIYLYTSPAEAKPVVAQDEGEAVLDAFSGTQAVAHREAVHLMIRRLKDGGVWDRLGALWVLAADTGANALVDWIRPGVNDLTLVGAPAFTAFQGYTGNGVDTLLQSTQNVSTVPLFASGDAHMAFHNTVGGVGSVGADISIGVSKSDYLVRGRSEGDRLNVRFGNVATMSSSGRIETDLGRMVIASRDDLASVKMSYDGRYVYGGDVAQSEDTIADGPVFLLGRQAAAPFEVSTRTMGAASVGASLSKQQASIYRNAVTEYLSTVGQIQLGGGV